jgi:hypothetical protein
MFHVPNKYRERYHSLLKSSDNDGNNGVFIIPHPKISGYELRVQASDGMFWEHASVSVAAGRRKEAHRCPTWAEMCFIKKTFWDEEDCVIEFHPPKSQYVNFHPFVLHLWRPIDQVIPMPLKEMIG